MFPVTLVLIVLVNLLFSNPEFESLEEELKEHIILSDKQKKNVTYWKLIQQDSLNVEYHFNFIKSYFELPLSANGKGRGNHMEYNQVVDYYREKLGSYDPQIRDIGKFGRGMFGRIPGRRPRLSMSKPDRGMWLT